jgi:hypothetical protein
MTERFAYGFRFIDNGTLRLRITDNGKTDDGTLLRLREKLIEKNLSSVARSAFRSHKVTFFLVENTSLTVNAIKADYAL